MNESLTPILRIFNAGKAKQFYLEFLEFSLDWEHRPGLELTPWQTKEVQVGDPFGNRLIFYEQV